MAGPAPRFANDATTGLPEPSHELMGASQIPEYASAVLEALRFDKSNSLRLQALNDEEWEQCLKFCDRTQLTLVLGRYCRGALPDWVRARIEKNLASYGLRFERIKTDLKEITGRLEASGIEYVVLKGMTHSPHLTPDPILRAQGDIDLWCEPDRVFKARERLEEMGYRAVGTAEGRHLSPMLRPTPWQWHGDYFASDLPVAVELHFRLWDDEFEFIRIPGETDLWDRRTRATFDGRSFPVLCRADTLGFAAAHLMMHLLHGQALLQRTWEIAHFLHAHRDRESFWEEWRRIHPPELRRIEAIVFALAEAWFDCALSTVVQEEITALPGDVRLWLQHFSYTPLESLFRAKKQEIWLQFALVEGWQIKGRILRRRLFPSPVANPLTTGIELGQWTMLGRRLKFLAPRAIHHARALAPTLIGGVKWWWIGTQLGRDFLRFQAAAMLVTLGNYVFLLLYNLWLLDRGYRENVLGQIASAVTAGTIAGIIPAAALIRRLGLRRSLLIAFLGSAAVQALRTMGWGIPELVAPAFLQGVFFSVWAVAFSPVIASLTVERNRAFAFSLNCAVGMGLGVIGGTLGGHLPGLIQHVSAFGQAAEAKRLGLVIGAAAIALAAIPVSRLHLPALPARESKSYPHGRFITGFLIALCVWSLATGGFNPFFNTYFSTRVGMRVEHIGLIFSLAQLAQMFMVLMAPMVLQKMGYSKGIAAMQAATGVSLAVMAVSVSPVTAGIGFTAYMCFQYMSEPAILSMLMNRVAPGERSGASALYFLASSTAGGFAVLGAGFAITKLGYPILLASAALIAVASAMLFRMVVHESGQGSLPVESRNGVERFP